MLVEKYCTGSIKKKLIDNLTSDDTQLYIVLSDSVRMFLALPDTLILLFDVETDSSYY